MSERTVIAVHGALRDDIGTLRTVRPLPTPSLPGLDPFLLLNHHGPQVYPPRNQGLPFGPHPHRGFETVTCILDGSLAHLDSGGHRSIIDAGGVQWMTAGRGLVHAEVSPTRFRETGGPLEILQLWVNLPAARKMVEPRYIGLQQADLPTRHLTTTPGHGVRVTAMAGVWDGLAGPVVAPSGVAMALLALDPGATATMAVPPGRELLFYVVRGEVRMGDGTTGHLVPTFALAQLDREGDMITVTAPTPAVVLIGHGTPLGEPVVAQGPFVMNTRDEIRQAMADYQAGRFGWVDVPDVI